MSYCPGDLILVQESSMKIALLTICDENYSEISSRTLPSMRRYADRFGLDLLSMLPDTKSCPAAWSKITCIRDVLQSGFEYCFYVDADAMFVRFDRDIRECLRAEKDLYICCHTPNNSEKYAPIPTHFNAGVMVWSSSAWSISFLNELLQQTDFIHHYWCEQAALLKQLGYHSIIGQGRDDPNPNRLKHVQQLPVDWNVIVGQTIASDPIITHFAGRSKARRLEDLDYEIAFQSVRETLPKYARYLLARLLNLMSFAGKWAELKHSRSGKAWWRAVGVARALAKLAIPSGLWAMMKAIEAASSRFFSAAK
jgi:Nucleotide-diphospho-sugar transferase